MHNIYTFYRECETEDFDYHSHMVTIHFTHILAENGNKSYLYTIIHNRLHITLSKMYLKF